MTAMSTGKSNRIELWIRFWGIGMVLAGLSTFLIKTIPSVSSILIIGFGLLFILGNHIHRIRLIGLFFSAFLVIGSCAMAFLQWNYEPHTFRFYYFLSSGLFYFGFFIFLLLPPIKQAFHPPPPKPLPALTQEEEKKIKFWVRLIAAILMLDGVISFTLSDWFRTHGVPTGGAGITIVFYSGAALGLLFLRQNIGRRFTLFICLTAFVGSLNSSFGKNVFGFWGYFYTAIVMLILFASFLFLLHPKTKAVFKTPQCLKEPS